MAATNAAVWDLADDERVVFEGWLAEFEQSWGEGRLAEHARRLPAGGPLRRPALVEMAKIDLELRWRGGRPVTVEDYLRDFPELGTPATAPADLLQAEVEARLRAGDAVALSAVAARFPGRAEELRQPPDPSSGPVPSTLHQSSAPSALELRPAGGSLPEQFGRYRIVRRLGR